MQLQGLKVVRVRRFISDAERALDIAAADAVDAEYEIRDNLSLQITFPSAHEERDFWLDRGRASTPP